jgi:hypothetical protein
MTLSKLIAFIIFAVVVVFFFGPVWIRRIIDRQ